MVITTYLGFFFLLLVFPRHKLCGPNSCSTSPFPFLFLPHILYLDLSLRDTTNPFRMPSHSYLEKLTILLCAIGNVWGKAVTTTNGTIEGGRCESSDANSFLAIPYAQPPVAALRFAAPESYNTTYDGVLRATSRAPNCPQFTTGGELVEGTFSEDWYDCFREVPLKYANPELS